MWARITELVLGGWLLLSPFVVGNAESDTATTLRGTIAGITFIGLALFSLWRPTSRANGFTVGASLVLVASAFFAGAHPLPPAAQNDIVVGLCLLMLGVVPNRASEPPIKWRSHFS